jgi:TonB family protein
MPTTFRLLASLLLAAALHGCASAPPEAVWPDTIVSIDDMRPNSPWQVGVPPPAKDKVRDRSHNSEVVLQVHVDSDGQVQQVRVYQSSNNPVLDEAVLHTMRQIRFAPYRTNGVAQPVTVLAPMRFPFYDRDR